MVIPEVKPSLETYRAKAMPVKPKNGSTTKILHHATEYGAWCTGMKNQLDTLTRWFEEKTE